MSCASLTSQDDTRNSYLKRSILNERYVGQRGEGEEGRTQIERKEGKAAWWMKEVERKRRTGGMVENVRKEGRRGWTRVKKNDKEGKWGKGKKGSGKQKG